MKVLVILGLACLVGQSADNILTPEERQAGFKLLFDGKTMRGWRDPARMNLPGDAWVVRDGCLKTAAKPRIREDLLSEDTYRNFELKFDWLVGEGANSGVKYLIQQVLFIDDGKVKTPPGGGWIAMLQQELDHPRCDRASMTPGATANLHVIGFEFQLLGRNEATAPPYNDMRQATGALYSMIPPSSFAATPPGAWNEARIVVAGSHVEHWINGVKVVDGSFASEEARAGIRKRWAGAPTLRDMLLNPKPGPISLQYHGSADVRFKNLKIRVLP